MIARLRRLDGAVDAEDRLAAALDEDEEVQLDAEGEELDVATTTKGLKRSLSKPKKGLLPVD